MLNIEKNPEKVNTPDEKKLNFFNQTLLTLPEFALWQGPRVQYPDGTYGYEWNARSYEPAQKCPYGVPKTALLDSRPHIGTTGKRIPPVLKYEALYDDGAKGYISNKVLFETARERHYERPILQAEISDTEHMYFLGRQKGCETYNNELRETLLEKSSALVENNKTYFFLTVTYAQNIHGKNICEAWQIFNLQIKRLFQNLRKKFLVDYVCVFESTLKGYPHAHIVLACNKGLKDDFSALAGGEIIENGDFYTYLKKNMPSPVFTLQKAVDKNLKNYLTKYISKSTQADIFAPLPKDDEHKKTVRKNLLSCLLPVLAGVRQFRYSLRNSKAGDQLGTEMLDGANISAESALAVEMDGLRADFQLGIISAEKSAALISLCTNLLQNCKGHVYMMSHVPPKSPWRTELGYFDTPPPDVSATFRQNARSLGCPGCTVYQSLMRLMGVVCPSLNTVVAGRSDSGSDVSDAPAELGAMYAEIALDSVD